MAQPRNGAFSGGNHRPPRVWGFPYHALDLVETSQGFCIPLGKAVKGHRA